MHRKPRPEKVERLERPDNVSYFVRGHRRLHQLVQRSVIGLKDVGDINSGRLLVTIGYLDEFRRLSRLLNREAEQDPRILLSKAYFEYVSGQHKLAQGYLSNAFARADGKLPAPSRISLSNFQLQPDTGRRGRI